MIDDRLTAGRGSTVLTEDDGLTTGDDADDGERTWEIPFAGGRVLYLSPLTRQDFDEHGLSRADVGSDFGYFLWRGDEACPGWRREILAKVPSEPAGTVDLLAESLLAMTAERDALAARVAALEAAREETAGTEEPRP